MHPHECDLPDFAELLAAGDRALRQAGKEVAAAKTEAESQAAALRQKTYSEAFDNICGTLLGIALRRLQREPEPDFTTGGYTGLVGYGRQNLNGDVVLIPFQHWEAGAMDWGAR